MEVLSASEKIKVKNCYGIYNGKDAFKQGNVEVLPVKDFLEMLWSEKIF
jgi:hypothetical protein